MSPGPFGREPRKSLKRVRKGVPGPKEPQSPKRARPSLFLDSFRSPGCTLLGLCGSPALEASGQLSGLSLSDSFGVLGPKGQEPLGQARGFASQDDLFLSKRPCSEPESYLSIRETILDLMVHLGPKRSVLVHLGPLQCAEVGTLSFWEFPNLVVCNFYAEALFCALLRPFALFCRLMFGNALFKFADIFALLRSFACFCVRPRFERQRQTLGTADLSVS